MATIEVEGKKIEIDDEGFLVNMDDWNEKVACMLADKEGVSKTCPLSKERMDILKFMRDYYKENKAFPVISNVCLNVHQGKQCVAVEFANPVTAWKIAGLPRLTPEMYKYLTLP